MARPRDRMLDVIRGAAILLVLVFHLRVATGVEAIDLLIRPVIDVGWVGVDLFFVLSGLLIGGIVLDQIDSPGGFSRTRFFGRRACCRSRSTFKITQWIFPATFGRLRSRSTSICFSLLAYLGYGGGEVPSFWGRR